MTIQEINAKIDRVMKGVTGYLEEADVPVDTGRLRSAIKVRKVGNNYEVYVNTDGEEDAESLPMGTAPYAAKVNKFDPYWRRLFMVIHDRLRRELGAEFRTNYRSRGE